MPNPHTDNRTKPSARRAREQVRERPGARAPVARGVFGHSAQPSSEVGQQPPVEPQAPPQSPPQPQTEQVTAKRAKPATEGAVLVTGVCGRLGRLLVRELHRTDRVVGVDRRSFDDRPKDILHHQIDMRRKKMKDIFRGRDIRAVVHLGILHDPRRSDRERHSWNIVAFQKLTIRKWTEHLERTQP